MRLKVCALVLTLLAGVIAAGSAEARRKREPAGAGATCCKVCTRGCACGDSCISCSKVCRKAPGCACNAR